MHGRRILIGAISLGLFFFGMLAPSEAAAQSEVTRVEQPAVAEEQEIGAEIGAEVGGRVSPGGFLIRGMYLYQLSDQDWLESSVGFTYGASGADCFTNRDGDMECNHGLASGFAGEVGASIRRFFGEWYGAYPYARAGLAVRAVSFGSDGVRGVAFPVTLGGGLRAPVSRGVAIVGGATAKLGVGFYNKGLGAEPHATLAIHAGVEFGLF